MTTCSAFGCSYDYFRKKIPEKTIHGFPFSRPDILQLWIKNISRKDWKPSHSSFLCSDHFKQECFDRTGKIVRLRQDAVPTIFNLSQHFQKELFSNAMDADKSAEIDSNSKKRKTNRTCFVPKCTTGYKSNKEKKTLFSTPRDAELLRKWRNMIPRKDRALGENDAVCEKHFKEEYIERFFRHVINGEEVLLEREKPKLLDDALPTEYPDLPSFYTKKLPQKIHPKFRELDTKTCSAFGCSYKKGSKNIPETSVHSFPFNRPDILKQWITNMRRKDWQPSRTSILCSDHFEEKCFDRTKDLVKLHKDAVPTIFNFPQHSQKELDSVKSKAELKTPHPLPMKQEPFEVIADNTDIQTALFNVSDKNRVLVVPGDLDIQSAFSNNYGNTNDQNHVLLISDDTCIQTVLKSEDVDDCDEDRAIIISDGTNDTNIGIRSLNNCITDSSYDNSLRLHSSEFYSKRIEGLAAVVEKLKRERKLLQQSSRRQKTKITKLRKKVSRIIRNNKLIASSAQPTIHSVAIDNWCL